MINIQMDWNDVKDSIIDCHFNNYLLMAWVFIIKDDDVVKVWEFRFEEV